MTNNLVITGISRSGTSYLCSLLNGMGNTVIVNEPQEVFQLLHNSSRHTLKEYYDRTRSSILNRIPIQNKIIDGKFIEDTNEGDVRNYYIAEVGDPSFVFGTKNTLIYLVCIRKITRQLPDAKILACIRHPYDTIASWKKVKFPHLRNACPLFLKDYVNNTEGERIARICHTGEFETRYALLWNYLAMCIIDSIDDVILFKYEEFVRNPAGYVSDLYAALGVNLQEKLEIAASKPRRHENVLSVAERESVQKHCSDSAGYFGYKL